jgi:hypothetical protein
MDKTSTVMYLDNFVRRLVQQFYVASMNGGQNYWSQEAAHENAQRH